MCQLIWKKILIRFFICVDILLMRSQSNFRVLMLLIFIIGRALTEKRGGSSVENLYDYVKVNYGTSNASG